MSRPGGSTSRCESTLALKLSDEYWRTRQRCAGGVTAAGQARRSVGTASTSTAGICDEQHDRGGDENRNDKCDQSTVVLDEVLHGFHLQVLESRAFTYCDDF